jgi:hypothetical protein
MSRPKTIDELAQAYRDAEQEYQFAMVSSDEDRLKAAIRAKSKAWNLYSKAKKASFSL